MRKKKKDLLPVVVIRERRATTTSLEVARIFTKKHQHVLRDIAKIETSESFSQSNFGQSDYIDERGKTQKMYEMTRDGFIFLVMGYRGQAAAAFKEAFIGEFNRREKEIARLQSVAANNRLNLEWTEARQSGKPVRRTETDAIQRFVNYAASQGSQNSNRYYMILSKMANSLLFDASQNVKNVRDICDTGQLGTLKIADTIIRRALEEDMALGVHYKEIYKNAKAKVLQFVELYGKSEIPGSTLQIGGN